MLHADDENAAVRCGPGARGDERPQGLIEPRGRKEVPGRPTLWGTTQAFLTQFGLRDIRELPRREDLLGDGAG